MENMYNYLIKSNNVLYISNKVVSKLPVYSKIEGIEKNYIKLNCSFERTVDISKKELEDQKCVSKPLFIICESMSLPYGNQILHITKYLSDNYSRLYRTHINYGLWKILAQASLSKDSVYGILMNATKSNYLIGISGYVLSILNNNKINHDFSYTKIIQK